jgi:Mn-dependent DtxR family transcriptional regulator
MRQVIEEQRERWDIHPPDADARWKQALEYARKLEHAHDDDDLEGLRRVVQLVQIALAEMEEMEEMEEMTEGRMDNGTPRTGAE